MITEDAFERGLRSSLRIVLDNQPLPHPGWSDAPAARKLADHLSRKRRVPLRLLAVAAVFALGAAAVGVGAVINRQSPPPVAPTFGWISYSAWNGASYDIAFTRRGVPPVSAVGAVGDGLYQTCPAFSPDGQVLAYITEPDGTSDTWAWSLDIVRLDANGLPSGAPHSISFVDAGYAQHGCVAWSPDGQLLAFSAISGLHVVSPNNGADLLVAGLGHTDQTVGPGDWTIGTFDWALDSQRLAYVRNYPGAVVTSELWIASLAGDQKIVVEARSEQEIDSIAWAKDGRTLFYGSKEPERLNDGLHPGLRGVRILDTIDDKKIPVIVDEWDMSDFGLNQGPSLSPDGSRIAYIKEGTLVIRNAAGITREVDIPGLDRTPTAACVAAWSPAGDSLAIAVLDEPFLDRRTESALVLVDADATAAPVVVRSWGRFEICGPVSWQAGGQ